MNKRGRNNRNFFALINRGDSAGDECHDRNAEDSDGNFTDGKGFNIFNSSDYIIYYRKDNRSAPGGNKTSF